MTNADGPNYDRRIPQLVFSIAFLCVAVVVITMTLNVIARQDWYVEDVLRKHPLAIVGVPEAMGVALALVVFLRQTDGPIEFEGLGFKLKGAAGQVTMWIMTFLAIAGAMKLLW